MIHCINIYKLYSAVLLLACSRCILLYASPQVLPTRTVYTVRIPFGILGVRFLLRAVTAAQTALGLQLPVGPREPWNVPVAPKAGQTTKLVAHAWPEGLRCCRSVPLVLAKAGSSGSNQLHRAYFSPDSSAFAGAIVDSTSQPGLVF